MENKVFELKERKNSLTSCIVQGRDLFNTQEWLPVEFHYLLSFIDLTKYYHFPNYKMLVDFLMERRERVIHVFTSDTYGPDSKYGDKSIFTIPGDGLLNFMNNFVRRKHYISLLELQYMIDPKRYYNFNGPEYLIEYLKTEGFKDKVGDLCG